MARRPTLSDQVSDAALSPEWALDAAIVRQAVKDLADPSPYVRAEAKTFWANTQAVRFWSDLCGIALERYAP